MNVRDTAKIYLAKQWSVIPIKKNDKRPIIRWGKFRYERMKETDVEKFFKKACNIGIVTGKISQLVVLDYDINGNDDKRFLEKLFSTDTLTVETGNGFHFYYAYPGFPVRSRNRLLPFLDVRGDNGYVVAPPSVHENGKVYRFINESEIRQLPDFIKDLLHEEIF